MAKKVTVESIEANGKYAAAAAILRTLESGFRQLEAEADALRIEDHLSRQPRDPRAEAMTARLKSLRGGAPQKAAQPSASDADLPPSVMAALELLRVGVRPARRDRRAAIAQLKEDAALVREGIAAQQAIVDGIRGELSAEAAQRLKGAHRELVVEQYRALQKLAATSDAVMEFRRAFVAGGYSWREDLLPTPASRAALIAGSEQTFDSEVRRIGRLLEELKLLP